MNEQDEMEAEADAVLGGVDDDTCTYAQVPCVPSLYAHTRARAHTDTQTYAQTHTHTHTHTHSNTHANTHTHIHTYTHKHISTHNSFNLSLLRAISTGSLCFHALRAEQRVGQ